MPILLLASLLTTPEQNASDNASNPSGDYPPTHKFVEVDGVSIFYREAGNPAAPTVVMLHGFPSSSHMYRQLIAGLSDRYHLIAPDYPGFGFSDRPSPEKFDYNFDRLGEVMNAFLEKLELKEYYLLMQDYGGPVGMRIATAHPGRVRGLIIQNANVYEEGLGEWSRKIGGHAERGEKEELLAFRDHLMSAEGIKKQYLTGAEDPDDIDPISYLMDIAFMDREDAREIQGRLFLNYGKNNIPKYPEWQAYLKDNQPRTLILWGENDKFFSREGGAAYGKDLKNVETHFFDGGHFMLEEYTEESVALIRKFLAEA